MQPVAEPEPLPWWITREDIAVTKTLGTTIATDDAGIAAELVHALSRRSPTDLPMGPLWMMRFDQVQEHAVAGIPPGGIDQYRVTRPGGISTVWQIDSSARTGVAQATIPTLAASRTMSMGNWCG